MSKLVVQDKVQGTPGIFVAAIVMIKKKKASLKEFNRQLLPVLVGFLYLSAYIIFIYIPTLKKFQFAFL